MAQTAQINISINTQNAIKSIGELDSEIGGSIVTINDLELAISSLQEELKSTEFGTERFKQLSAALVDTQGKMKDFELSIESLDAEQRASEFGSFAAGLAEIATGALALTHALGLGSDETDKFVEKMVGGFAIANSLRGGLEGIISAQKLLKNSTLASTAATEGGTVAMKVFNAVAKANPIGILLTLLAGAVAAFALFSGEADEAGQSVEELAETQKKLREEKEATNKAIAEQSGEFVGLLVQLKATNAGSDERLNLINDINDTYGLTLQNLSDEKDFQEQVNVAVDEYIKLQRNKFRQEKNQEKINELLERQFEVEESLRINNEIIDKNLESSSAKRNNLTRGQIINSMKLSETLNGQITELEEIDKELEKLGVSTLELKGEQDELTDSGKKYEKQTKETTKTVKDTTKATKEQSLELRKLNKLKLTDLGLEGLSFDPLQGLNESFETELKLYELNLRELGLTQDQIDSEMLTKQKEVLQKRILLYEKYGINVTDLLLELARLEADITADQTKQFLTQKQQQIIDFIMASVGQAMNILDQALTEVSERQSYTREIELQKNQESLDKQLANRTLTEEQYNNKVEELQRTREVQETQARKKQFKQQKAFNLAQATMSVAQTILSILQSSPDPLKPIGPLVLAQLATAGVIGGAQIGVIAGQQFRAARGGIVPGAPSSIDSVPSLLAPGEMVINSNSSTMFGELLSAVNQIGGGIPLTPNVPAMSTGNAKDSVFSENKPQSPIRAYVMETEITDKQKKISRIQRSSEF